MEAWRGMGDSLGWRPPFCEDQRGQALRHRTAPIQKKARRAFAFFLPPNFREHSSLLKKSLSGRSADQKRIQHCQTKAKTLRKKGL